MSQVIKNYSRVVPERMHDVRANARGLGILYTIEVELSRLVGCWIAQTPELPEKMLLGRILYENAEHAERLEKRLVELRVAPDRLPGLRERSAPALLGLAGSEDPAEFLSGLFHVVKPALLADLRRHLDGCPPYSSMSRLRASCATSSPKKRIT